MVLGRQHVSLVLAALLAALLLSSRSDSLRGPLKPAVPALQVPPAPAAPAAAPTSVPAPAAMAAVFEPPAPTSVPEPAAPVAVPAPAAMAAVFEPPAPTSVPKPAAPVAVPAPAAMAAVFEPPAPTSVPEPAAPVAAPAPAAMAAVFEPPAPTSVPEPAAPVAVPAPAAPAAVFEPPAPTSVPEPAAPVAVPVPAAMAAVFEPPAPSSAPEPAAPVAVPAPAAPAAVFEPPAPTSVPEPAAPVALPAPAAPAAVFEPAAPTSVPEPAGPAVVPEPPALAAVPAPPVPVLPPKARRCGAEFMTPPCDMFSFMDHDMKKWGEKSIRSSQVRLNTMKGRKEAMVGSFNNMLYLVYQRNVRSELDIGPFKQTLRFLSVIVQSAALDTEFVVDSSDVPQVERPGRRRLGGCGGRRCVFSTSSGPRFCDIAMGPGVRPSIHLPTEPGVTDVPYRSKQNLGFWRGAVWPAGRCGDWRRSPRVLMCQASQKHPDVLNASLGTAWRPSHCWLSGKAGVLQSEAVDVGTGFW
ncbi:unnamed protein product [Effrenium voratum]|uniref:Uncharacterized protein n=1 Tax=Effrenium voratum TaxID=2562239 RepID=A0AA36NDB3_9DINO|nr:unnamed protein product [Effrenium voratum]